MERKSWLKAKQASSGRCGVRGASLHTEAWVIAQPVAAHSTNISISARLCIAIDSPVTQCQGPSVCRQHNYNSTYTSALLKLFRWLFSFSPVAYAALVVQLEFPEVKDTKQPGQSCCFSWITLSPPKRTKLSQTEIKSSIACQFWFTFCAVFSAQERSEKLSDVESIKYRVSHRKYQDRNDLLDMVNALSYIEWN